MSFIRLLLALKAVNTEPPPTKGSMMRRKSGALGIMCFSSFSLPPAHLIMGFSDWKDSVFGMMSGFSNRSSAGRSVVVGRVIVRGDDVYISPTSPARTLR